MKNTAVLGRTNRRLRRLMIGVVVLVVALGVVVPQLFAARAFAAGSMYLDAAPSMVIKGGTVAISFRINPSTPVTVVEGVIGFDSAKLQYVGVDTTGTSFDTSIKQTVSDSKISVVRAKLDPSGVTGDALIVKVIFKALSSAGSSAVTLSNANAVFDGAYTNPSVVDAMVAFGSGACPAGQIGLESNCTSSLTSPKDSLDGAEGAPQSNNSSLSTDTAKTTSPIVSDVPVVGETTIEYTTLTINATTRSASTVYLVYGSSKDNLITQTTPAGKGLSHRIVIDKGLTPGSEVFYKLVGVNEKTTSSTDVQSLRLRGFTAKLTLMDQAMNVLPHEDVVLVPSNRATKSDANGVATYADLMPGDYVVQLTKNGQTYKQHVSILTAVEVDSKGAQTANEQQVAVVFDGYTNNAAASHWIGPLVGAALLLIAGAAIWSWHQGGVVRRFISRLNNRVVAYAVARAARRPISTPLSAPTPIQSSFSSDASKKMNEVVVPTAQSINSSTVVNDEEWRKDDK